MSYDLKKCLSSQPIRQKNLRFSKHANKNIKNI